MCVKLNQSFERILDNLGVDPSLVSEVFALKLGAVAFSDTPEYDRAKEIPLQLSSGVFVTTADTTSKLPGMVGDLVGTLKAHPNVFEVQRVGTEEKEEVYISDSIQGPIFLIVGPKYSLRINLPARHQKSEAFLVPGEVVESFSVLTSGSLFCAYASVTDPPSLVYFAHEYRELVTRQTETGKKTYRRVLGPTPIHPTIWVLKVATPSDGKPVVTSIREHRGDIYVIVDAGLKATDVVGYVFDAAQHALFQFYESMIARVGLMSLDSAIGLGFRELSKTLAARQSKPFWRLLSRERLGGQAESHLSELYEILFHAQNLDFQYNESRTQTLESVRGNRILGPLEKYFSQHLDTALKVPDSLFPALGHFSEQLRSFDSSRVALVSSVIGAIIGAVLAALLTH